MKIKLICVGTKMPTWVEQGFQEYKKRLPREFELQLKEVAMMKRTRSNSIEMCKKKEAQGILSHIKKSDFVVALEVGGKSMGTLDLAAQLDKIRQLGNDLCLLVGGPDGLDEQCLQRANQCWSLSELTLPHPLVRVLLAEQLYRVWSVLNGHPYHRE
ncbi:MAG: 23S rRNA (pseudouridine(1915)-N(3))-methyltransferase RlmH [SAR86 cluster bacterium]|uniref:Ribosomal RNA large subunit methyltransferase H n=1 Tax=SAR86 cluster bacterium TaxID=2030880 RepID=A0A2A4MHG0_9GAMM|nr:MAG: 23S rRNA (pseudouridine(1915)-N(3))-methyltransferase RlmH [SAR86 cluster bacterium]